MARRPIDGEDHLDITDSDQFEPEQATTNSGVFEVGEATSEGTGSVDSLDIADGGKIEVEQTGAASHLEQHGIVDGYSNGTFKPDDAITRAEVAKMTNLENELPDSSHETTFTDADTVSDWEDSAASGLPLEATIGKYHEERGQTADNYQKLTDPSADKYQVEEDQAGGEYHLDITDSDQFEVVKATTTEYSNESSGNDNPVKFKDADAIDATDFKGADLEGLNLKQDDALDSDDTLVAGVVGNALDQALDASTPQGAPTSGPDEIAAPFIPGGSGVSAAELDEDDPKPIDTEDA